MHDVWCGVRKHIIIFIVTVTTLCIIISSSLFCISSASARHCSASAFEPFRLGLWLFAHSSKMCRRSNCWFEFSKALALFGENRWKSRAETNFEIHCLTMASMVSQNHESCEMCVCVHVCLPLHVVFNATGWCVCICARYGDTFIQISIDYTVQSYACDISQWMKLAVAVVSNDSDTLDVVTKSWKISQLRFIASRIS